MKVAETYFGIKKWQPADFQEQNWQAILKGQSGLLNAPTGCGKTFAIWFGILQVWANASKNFTVPIKGLRCLWITPLKSLSKEIVNAANEVSEVLGLPIKTVLRTGDTSTAERSKQLTQVQTAMVTTPESVHIILSGSNSNTLLNNLDFIVVDEWHELLGTKRGVLIELALSRLKKINPKLQIWGISATIGNLEEAMQILLGVNNKGILIQSKIHKQILLQTVYPDSIDMLPWSGHIGLQMTQKVKEIIENSNTTLVFTNTRAQAEIWYKAISEISPELAGLVALHHGSLSMEIRNWVEENLHLGKLKAVVCTSSLDLGVDFEPVDTVVQIGSPKGVARFMQRAGRSGHQPGAISKIYLVPTHSLEIIEGAALRHAVEENHLETRVAYIRSFDVLCQYLVTLAVGIGFFENEIFEEVKNTNCFRTINEEEWQWCLTYITKGGDSLEMYPEFKKVQVLSDGCYRVVHKGIAMRHRLGIGAIVSGALLQIKLINGKLLGSVEEYFISNLQRGDKFWFAGRCLEYIQIKDLHVQVRQAKSTSGNIPSYMGGRMPLSSQLSAQIRYLLDEEVLNKVNDKELELLKPLLSLQKKLSALPKQGELLIEKFWLQNNCHVFIYPFEGRNTHEGMGAMLIARLGKIKKLSASMAMNDYGFHWQSDEDIPIEEAISKGLFSLQNLQEDTMQTLNAMELSKRRFRDIAVIGGLLFNGYPGASQKTRHLQASAQLFWQVFSEYEPNNLLLQQAYDEVLFHQMEFDRLYTALQRILQSKIVLTYPEKPTPLCFPILVDILREKFTNEDLETRVKKMLG